MQGTILGFVVGSLIGAVATSVGSYVVLRRRRRAAVKRLRLAFETELAALSYVEELSEAGRYEELAASVEDPVVYETNAGEIGRLTDEEVEALVTFYTDLYWLHEQQDIEDKKERVDGIADEWRRALEAVRAAAD
ncbi:hypothetical protein [Halorarum salinum]|uniref:Uncharacterized protein n=1 Tax=Halorarum salinum TaxID=2743089 RepID=A0A7D5LB17_9EURY|nr:hypothetical protein [Halobaculum salinum]QLG62247.1 hypothetical protein HUG12_11110 [Halobaculum salinum]